jgi:hypothetical protein
MSVDPQATTLPSQAPLPTGVPARIYPPDSADPSTADLADFTFISILFNQELNWEFVSQNTVASSQIFAYFPQVFINALNITASQVQTFALQVWIPPDYSGPVDGNSLLTVYLAWLPSSTIAPLAAQMKVLRSPFYNGTTGIPAELAARVDSAFSLDSVPSPNSGPGSNLPLSAAAGQTSQEKTRQDAIIGVVGALGALALIILVVLIYRSFKRRQELAHHRLSGDDYFSGQRPVGREFDEDSIGGQRRRSFYYAEDSLRGFQEDGQGQQNSGSRVSPTQMSQRRVIPAVISAPVLTESSMNW